MPKTISTVFSVALEAAASETVRLGGRMFGCWATAQPQITDTTAPAARTRAPRCAPRRSRTSTATPQTAETTTSGSPSLLSPSKTARASACRATSPAAASAPVTTAATSARSLK